MIGEDSGIDYLERLIEKKAKEELIPKIAELLQHFSCEQCASCCRNAGIDLSPAEAVEMLRHKGTEYFDMLDSGSVRDRLKAPCGLLEGNRCSVYEKRPESCRIYPFAWVQRGALALYQCPLGREVTAALVKFAEVSGFKVKEAEPEKVTTAIGMNGKTILAATVPYTLLRQYHESMQAVIQP